jgi:Kef-type K+ transport system membrane component KefB
MGIGITELGLLLFFMIMGVSAALWTVRKHRNRNQQEKQQKKAGGLVFVGALVGVMAVFVLYALFHHP